MEKIGQQNRKKYRKRPQRYRSVPHPQYAQLRCPCPSRSIPFPLEMGMGKGGGAGETYPFNEERVGIVDAEDADPVPLIIEAGGGRGVDPPEPGGPRGTPNFEMGDKVLLERPEEVWCECEWGCGRG